MKIIWNKLKGLIISYLVVVLLISFMFIFPVIFDYGESGGWIDLSPFILLIGIMLITIITMLCLAIAWIIWAYSKGKNTLRKVIWIQLVLLIIFVSLYVLFLGDGLPPVRLMCLM